MNTINLTPLSVFWPTTQIIIGFLLNKYCRGLINKMGGINSLVLTPVAPILSLVLWSLTRIEKRDYYIGFILGGLLLMPAIFFSKPLFGSSIIYISMFITVIVYTLNADQDGIGPVIVGLVVCWLCKDISNPISVIIGANMIADYLVVRVFKSGNNKFKLKKEAYDNKGTPKVFMSGMMEALLIGAPSDVTSDDKPMMEGVSDVLCIANMLINNSMRGSSTVVITGWLECIIFLCIITIIFLYDESLLYTQESEKVWPPTYSSDVISISNWQLGLVVMSLVPVIDSYNVVLCFIGAIIGAMFVRVKVTTSLFFTAKLIF